MARDVDSEGFQLLQYGIAFAEYPSVTFDITVRARVLLLRCSMSEVCLAELSVWYGTVESGDGEWRVAQGGGLNTKEQHLIEKYLSQSLSKEMQKSRWLKSPTIGPWVIQ